MKYTEYGLCVTIEELRKLIERVEHENKKGDMESCIYINGGEKPQIIQYCCYAECNSIDYTYNAK